MLILQSTKSIFLGLKSFWFNYNKKKFFLILFADFQKTNEYSWYRVFTDFFYLCGCQWKFSYFYIVRLNTLYFFFVGKVFVYYLSVFVVDRKSIWWIWQNFDNIYFKFLIIRLFKKHFSWQIIIKSSFWYFKIKKNYLSFDITYFFRECIKDAMRPYDYYYSSKKTIQMSMTSFQYGKTL